MDQHGIHLSAYTPFLIGSHGESPGKLTLQTRHTERLSGAPTENRHGTNIHFNHLSVRMHQETKECISFFFFSICGKGKNQHGDFLTAVFSMVIVIARRTKRKLVDF